MATRHRPMPSHLALQAILDFYNNDDFDNAASRQSVRGKNVLVIIFCIFEALSFYSVSKKMTKTKHSYVKMYNPTRILC